MIKLLMRVLTVRRVATFLRAPWCSSILMVDLWGCEKETERCDMSLTSLPIDKLDTGVPAVSVLAGCAYLEVPPP